MSQPFDLSLFPDLLPKVVKAFAAQQAALEDALRGYGRARSAPA